MIGTDISDFWADGSQGSRLLSSRLREKKEEERIAYLKTWKGQREEEERQRNAIAGAMWERYMGYERLS